MLSSAKKHHQFGLASFDKSLRVEAPIGSPTNQIINAAEKLRAIGRTTELYRNMLKAIQLLDNIEADRKSIFLFSDGLAEDRAYTHQDVIKSARRSGVIITGIGYPRSVSQSVGLQTLRRLSEETGGLFIETDDLFNLPQQFLNQPYDSIDNGGKLLIDIGPAVTNTSFSDVLINLIIETDTNDIKVNIPVLSLYRPNQFITSSPIVIEAPQPGSTQVSPPSLKIISKQPPQKETLETWLWYGIPVALAVLLFLTIASFIMTLRRQQGSFKTKDAQSDFKPYAYLILQDESKKRYPITRSTWRIGRSKDNELTLRDNSISRRHAEIHRDRGDKFTIIDLQSLNGVFVNNEKVDKQRLREGDMLEVGDVCMRFTLLSNEYFAEESTIIQNTKFPVAH